jgi:hypothetical protein
MKVIYKQILNVGPKQHIPLEEGSEILSVHEQQGKIYLWYVCDPSEPKTSNWFSVFGTGHPFEETRGERKYIGTCHMDTGLVWHVFEDC